MNRKHAVLGGWLLAAAMTAGCGGRGGVVELTQFPRWDFQQYQRLAVVPAGAADPRALADARVLTDRLTTLLAQNGAFTVLSRGELEAVMREQDLSRLADAADESTPLPEGRIEIAQALVAAKITDYRLIAERAEETVPIFAVDRRGRLVQLGEETVPVYRHGAVVEASVRVVDATTGKILMSHTARVAPKPRSARGQPPRVRPEDIARQAAADLAAEFYKEIAPTRIRVKLKSDMLIVATEYFDGQYYRPKIVPRDRADFLLVVRELPEAAEGNRFKAAVSVKEGRGNLWESAEFVWTSAAGPQGTALTVPTAPLRETGATEFTAKLYSVGNPRPVLERDFKFGKPEWD